MPRRFLLTLCALGPLTAISAPIPKENDVAKLQRLYGAWSDPDKDCSWELKGDQLRVSLPAADHSLGGCIAGPANAPRVLGEVEGDFVAVVKVVFPMPEREFREPGFYIRSGGLLIWGADGDYVVIRRCALKGMLAGSGEAFWVNRQSDAGSRLTIERPKKQADAAYLRLRREGAKIIPGWSQDEKTWKEYEAIEVGWGQKVKVGVVAENNSKVQLEVTFDKFTVSKPKK